MVVGMKAFKAYKFRLYPDKKQKYLINGNIGSSRFIYNYYLDKKTKMYREENANYKLKDMNKDLLKLYPTYQWLKENDSCAIRTSLEDLDRAFDNFFKGNSNYPNFKRKNIKDRYRTNCIRSYYKGKEYSNIKVDLEKE